LLTNADAVARVSMGADAGHRMSVAREVTSWLTNEHGFAATAPLPDVDLVSIDRTTVSFWTYYPQPASSPPPTSAYLGRLLRHLHSIGEPPVQLDSWVPLASLHDAVNDPAHRGVLTEPERRWLSDRIDQVRDQLADLDWPLEQGLIHGDAWAGNLLWHAAAGPDHVVLGDWDWVAYGPREVDLVPTWHAATRYGKGAAWTHAFTDAYGYDLASWPGFPTLMQMRDLVQLTGPIRRAANGDGGPFAAALRQRLDDVRHGDTANVWKAL
jgi:Ser/Thr protein kinase RdoA (MazF antagonist)